MVISMKLVVCIGSACQTKGSRQVFEGLKQLIAEKNLGDKVTLSGTFCLGECQKVVCVLVDGALYSVSPENVNEFFTEHVSAELYE